MTYFRFGSVCHWKGRAAKFSATRWPISAGEVPAGQFVKSAGAAPRTNSAMIRKRTGRRSSFIGKKFRGGRGFTPRQIEGGMKKSGRKAPPTATEADSKLRA